MATIDLKKIFAVETEVDAKIYNALIKAIKERHQEGFDYLKFKQSVNNLKAMDMDEDLSIKSAYATASTMGLTKTKLLSSLKHYKVLLGKEKESFAEAMQNQFASKIESKRTEASKLSKKIQEYQNKIQKMQQEMELYQQKIDNVDSEINAAKEKIEKTRDKFEKTYNAMVEIIDSDVTKIDTTIS